MTEPEALQRRRLLLLQELCKLADEIKRIDARLETISVSASMYKYEH